MSAFEDLLPIRARNILISEGIETMHDLRKHWDRYGSVKMFNGIGRKTNRDVEIAIESSGTSYLDAINRLNDNRMTISRMSVDIEYWKEKATECAERYNQLVDIRSKTNDSVNIILKKSKTLMAYIEYIESKLDENSISHVSLEEFSLIRSGAFADE